MENLWTWHMVAENAKDAAKVALTDTSVDIFANPTLDTQANILVLAKSGEVPKGRIEGSGMFM
jgi:hypothetical protein